MLQDGHQMFPHPRHDLLALLLILDAYTSFIPFSELLVNDAYLQKSVSYSQVERILGFVRDMRSKIRAVWDGTDENLDNYGKAILVHEIRQEYINYIKSLRISPHTAYRLMLAIEEPQNAKQYGLATRTDDEKLIGARIDAVIPELRLAFAFSQKGTDREAKVEEVLHFLCKAKRIQLFVIRQKDPIALATEIKQAFAKANLFINSDSQRDVVHLRKRYFAQKNNGN